VRIFDPTGAHVGQTYVTGEPIEWPLEGVSWDLAFELYTAGGGLPGSPQVVPQGAAADAGPSEVPMPTFQGEFQALAATAEGLPAADADPDPLEPGPIDVVPVGAPALGTNFAGLDFDQQATASGYYMIPPDPIGAAGPNHVVNVVNSAVEWYDKTGTFQSRQGLKTFFSSLNPTANYLFDPKVIYDQYADRFVIVALEKIDSPNTSNIYLAVSDDNDPNGTWYYHKINALENIGGTNYWADYPGFAIDSQVVYVTANIYDFANNYGGARLWILDKGLGGGGFYDGGAASVNKYDPPGTLGIQAVTMQPAHMFGAAPGTVGTWLVRYSGWTDGVNEYLSIIRVDNPLGVVAFNHQQVLVGDIDNTAWGMPDAPQLGSSIDIETNDRRALHAVWRNNSLWTCAQVVPGAGADSGQATAHWWEVDTTNIAALGLVQQGDVGAEDIAAGTFTYFPSIAVDGAGNMGIGFAASASSIYAGAYYTGRAATDPLGTVQATAVLKAGVDWYYRAWGGPRNRWGDYTGISVDPSDDATFWVYNQYAMQRGTILPSYPSEDGRWATHWGSFAFAQQPGTVKWSQPPMP